MKQHIISKNFNLNQFFRQYAERLGIRRQKEAKLKDKISFLEDSKAENAKVQTIIMASDRQLLRVRKDSMTVRDGLQEFRDEVEVLRNQLGSRSQEQGVQRTKLVSLKEQLEDKKVRLEVLKKKLGKTEKNLQDEKNLSGVKEMSVKEAEELLKVEKVNLKDAEKELRVCKENLFKQTEELQALIETEKNLDAEKSSVEASIKTLSGQVAKLDKERQRQQELLYSVDFQSQLMQRKVSRVSGDVPAADNEEFYAKISQLEKELEEQIELEKLLNQQCKRQSNELKIAEKLVVTLQEDEKVLARKMREVELETISLERAVQESGKAKEECLVSRDMARLEAKSIRAKLHAKTEKYYNLENRKAQLGLSTVEREKEIVVHQELLKSNQRNAEESRHKAALELAERKAKINGLKIKYYHIYHNKRV